MADAVELVPFDLAAEALVRLVERAQADDRVEREHVRPAKIEIRVGRRKPYRCAPEIERKRKRSGRLSGRPASSAFFASASARWLISSTLMFGTSFDQKPIDARDVRRVRERRLRDRFLQARVELVGSAVHLFEGNHLSYAPRPPDLPFRSDDVMIVLQTT